MKTLEKKARAYDEAIRKAAALYKASEPMSGCNVIIETLFPELKESEDEMIRKELLEHCKILAKPYIQTGNKCPQIQSWIAWLERQGELPIYNIPSKEIILAIWDLGNEWKELTGSSISTEYDTQLNYIQNHWHESEYYLRAMQNEQKLIDKDELKSKFKVGDWVVDKNGTIQQILSYKDGIYKHTNGYSSKMFEDEWRLWDIIKDAKDGDVLATDDGNICIFDGTVKDGKYPFAYCGFTKHRFEFYDRRLPFTNNNIYPATKEQYDTLMKAMSNTGYTFDFEKKELVNYGKDDIDKPNFNIGDWITNGIDVDKIIGIDLEDENYLFENGRKSDISLVDSNSHNWTIQDAKDGDILAVEDKNFITPFVAIYKERGLDFFNSRCFIGFDGNFYKSEQGHDIENIHPATKEQCIFLFQKMHEAGYEWDDEKKELKKIKVNEAMYDDDKLREAICE